MNETQKQQYYEQYKKDKEKGEQFFPDAIFKDALIALLIFAILVGLAYFIGAPLEARADPADNSYTPRPEWYFMFLFQLLKYFPSSLEVVGVVVLPTLAVLFLFILPLIDRSNRRHFTARPVVIVGTTLIVASIGLLSYLSFSEAPPPAESTGGDPTAALYTKNCSGCHGPTIDVPRGSNLHDIIAQGKHEGMPAWSADLSTDQIDALAGFILSPLGSQLFNQNCADCHETSELVSSDPLELKNSIEQGLNYPAHAGLQIPNLNESLTQPERTSLLNFLVAPDGQRLFQTNCSPCHGSAVAFAGEESELKATISQGGMHLEMPPWREKLSPSELDTLAFFVVDPASVSDGQRLFEQYCSACHGERIPRAEEFYSAREMIAGGGGHETMPVWGNVLTAEQLDALVSYTLNSAKGTSLEVGQDLFASNCASCHGDFGEGGANPARLGDVIAPISTSEYLKTRDDFTLRAVISQGQPNFGMSPFGSSFGGPLDDTQVDAIVTFMRSWEANPPVELPPEIAVSEISVSGAEIYQQLCAQCHAPDGVGGLGPSLSSALFQSANTDQEIFDSINLGHEATPMIAWGAILTSNQIQQLVEVIRQFSSGEQAPGATPTAGAVSFSGDVLPIIKAKCSACHGNLGGWDGSSYETVLNSGNNAPVVIAGDPENSLLAQKLLDTQSIGAIMPPAGKLPAAEIQVFLDWISAGALDN